MREFTLKTPPHKLVREIKRLNQRIFSLEVFFHWGRRRYEVSNKSRWKEYHKQCERIGELEKENGALRLEIARLKKNPRTSSKPPSSEIIKGEQADNKKKKSKRKIGAQPGHKRNVRKDFAPEEVDISKHFPLTTCSNCSGNIPEDLQKKKVIQQAELVEKPVLITEYTGHSAECPHCKTANLSMPAHIAKEGLIGPKLTALAGYLKGRCHCSITTIQNFYSDVLGTNISRGYISNLVMKVSDSLEIPYLNLVKRLWAEDKLNIDETSHKNNGDRLWNWCFRSESHTVFKIMETRGYAALSHVLTEKFKGKIVSDYYSVYRKYQRLHSTIIQYCLAHLIRDILFLTTLPSKSGSSYGKKLSDYMRKFFRVRNQAINEDQKVVQLELIRDKFLFFATENEPEDDDAKKIYKRLLKDGSKYFEFINDPQLEPTNNLAEQAIRYVVIDRKVTQGTRSENGMRWSERIWTTIATCATQGISPYLFIKEALTAKFYETPPPKLVESLNL